MANDLVRLTATEAVALLQQRAVSPLELVEAAALLEQETGLARQVPRDPA